MRVRNLLAVALASGSLGLGASTASAAVQLCLDDGAGGAATLCITDGGAGDSNSSAGAITYIGAYGAWTLNVATAAGNAVLPEFGIDLNSINVGTGTLTLSMTDTDQSYPGLLAGSSLNFTAGIGGTTNGTGVSYEAYVDDANAAFGKGSLIFAGSSGTGAFSSSGGNSATLTNPFSMSLFVTLTHNTSASSSFDFDMHTVPEPASLGLLALGFAGIGLVARRRRR